jgi:Cys-rich protein (TIGR01571 family)
MNSMKLWTPPNLEFEQNLPNEWSHGLFDCFSDMSVCLEVCFCTLCAAGKIADQLDNNGCCITCCSTNLFLLIDLRKRIRQR